MKFSFDHPPRKPPLSFLYSNEPHLSSRGIERDFTVIFDAEESWWKESSSKDMSAGRHVCLGCQKFRRPRPGDVYEVPRSNLKL